ncbi:dynamin family protein [Rhodanobacter sp. 115]|uniref:dynamin family protein n=1 Tax=Rhodanobacter sp. FW021-MT20 TaxID=1162282 RepID=UPI0034E48D00
MTPPFASEPLLALIDRLGRFFVWRRRSLCDEVRSGVLAVAAERDAANTSRECAKDKLREYVAKHAEVLKEQEALQVSLHQSLHSVGRLRNDVATLSAERDAASAAHERVEGELEELAAKHESTSTMYQLVAKLHDAKPEPHASAVEFNRLLSDDYPRFADAESSLAEEAKALMLLQSVGRELEMIARFPDIHRHRMICLAGGFSAGKSSFINSFIDDPKIRLAEGVRPVTAIPSYVVASDAPSIQACSINGGQFELEPELYSKLSHAFVQSMGFNLSDLMPFVFIGARLNAEFFEHVCLIDTPGYNAGHGVADGGVRDRQQASSLARQADGLIWMIGVDAGGVLTASDLEFLKEVGHKKPLYVVLNKCETKSEDDLVDLIERIADDLAGQGIDVAGVSAYSAIEQREIKCHDESLYAFLRKNNVPGDAGTALVERINEVFDMYDASLLRDTRRISMQGKALLNLALECYEVGGSDLREKMKPTLARLKNSLSAPPAPELCRQSRELREKFIECIMSVTGLQTSASAEPLS